VPFSRIRPSEYAGTSRVRQTPGRQGSTETLRRILHGEAVRGLAGERAREVLVKHGLLAATVKSNR
jgi:hypothetical protein